VRCLVFAFVAVSLCASSSGRRREATPEISWRCNIDAERARGGPASIIVDGRSFVLLSQGTSGCRTLQRSEYRRHDVPDDAISAAAGWFAGGGEEFYAVLQHRTLFVYHRLVEESGPLHPRYRLIARIPWQPTTPNQSLHPTADRCTERLKEEL